MTKDEQERKKFLEEQLKWCEEQDRLLEKIELKLHEMKEIAGYALNHEHAPMEIDQLNNQLNDLEKEVHLLEKQLLSIVH